MARTLTGTPTAEEAAALEIWLAERPAIIRELAAKYSGWTCYRSTENPRLHYAIVSYFEDGTVKLAHGDDSILPKHETFGQDPTKLIPCGCGNWTRGDDA